MFERSKQTVSTSAPTHVLSFLSHAAFFHPFSTSISFLQLLTKGEATSLSPPHTHTTFATCPVIRGLNLCSWGIDLLLSACSSLGIPSLFPMQINLMRIRSIMEPIHRSSWWKMGLTTNFPLQLFCNYFGALWILIVLLSCSDRFFGATSTHTCTHSPAQAL